MKNLTQNPTSATTFGVNLWWTVPMVKVDQGLAQSLLLKHGFDKEDMTPPTDHMEVSRAVYGMQDRRHKENRRITEKAFRDGTRVVWGILDREQSGEKVRFTQNTTVTLDKNHNRVNVVGTLVGEVNDAIAEYRDKMTDDDIRAFLLELVRKCNGIRKRPTGGIYFVPAYNASIIESARAFLAELGTGARIYVERVMDGQEERKNVWEAVEDNLDEILDGIMGKVETIEKRANALVTQQDKLNEAKEMVEVYQKLLGEEAKHQDIAAKIEVVVKAIGDKMTAFATTAQAKVEQKTRKGKHGKGQKKVRATGFSDAVLKVMQEAGAPMHIIECVKRIKAEHPQAVIPARPDAYLWRMAKDGILSQQGHGVFGIAKTA